VGSDTRVPSTKRGASKRRRRRRTEEPHVFARGEWWHGYYDEGRRESLGTKDHAEALGRFAERLAELRRAGPARAALDGALIDLVREYTSAPHGWTARTLHTAKLRCAAFVEAMHGLGVEAASQVTPAVLDGWRERRMAAAGRATILRDESAVRAMFKWCRARGLVSVDPFEGRPPIRTPKRRARRTVPTPAQVLAVATWLEEHDEVGAALALRVGLSTGLRLDELRHLQLVDVGERWVTVRPEDGAAAEAWTTKGYLERSIPVEPAVAELARAFVLWRESPRVMRWGPRKGQVRAHRSRTKALTAGWLAKTIDRARKALAKQTPAVEVAQFRPHDLRRLFVTMCSRAGVPLDVVQRWVGHADLVTTQGYLVTLVSDADLRAPALGV
jgi:integrase